MGKIMKKLNGVFFESSMDTSGWFIMGMLIAIFVMITLISAGMAEMVGDMLLQGIVSLLDMIVPLLQDWGTVEANSIDGLFSYGANSTTTMAICISTAAGIIILFTVLAIKFPEKIRKKKECLRI